ncbi:FecR family protein [Sphingobacterium paucimobilis]|uniref:FecR protein domain-containing protein n=1 Tax=Sphingobacterium paucimobilis HER1398 TaxID=1346330 RepID=U2J9Q2_9SPHI|nr:FecR domain-containing protein [Sphingobacterium paucimobilis]ERJ59398.1 hypothetical protein M472_11495 [Sphingobacterium paucimobilis HER1398]
MESDNISLEKLLQKHQDGSISKEELLLLEEWLIQGAAQEHAVTELEVLDDLREIRMRLSEKGLLQNRKRRYFGIRRFYSAVAAAAILVCVLGSLYLWQRDHTITNPVRDVANITVVQEGEEKAVLVLGNGEQVVLEGSMNAKEGQEIGKGIRNTGEGWLSYSSADGKSLADQPPTYHTLIVPKRSKYGLLLEDGTKVWLNAGSSLRFPDRFVGGKREVELDGEAYFEVQPRQLAATQGTKYEPFIVKSKSQQIQVLGTQFNVSAYKEDVDVLSTLIEGKVEVTATLTGIKQLLKPNQQSTVGLDGRIKVKEVDASEIKAWMDGSFVFANENLETILRRISRWYDVEIEVAPGLDTKRIHLNGSVDKFAKLKDLLDVLEMTRAVRFEIKGSHLLVKKKE